MPRHRIAAQRQSRPSACVACKGAATGYNYGAPTCYSCKTFFRRTILQEKMYLECKKNDVCKREESIRACKTCRFERCVSGGMNPLILHSLENPESNPVVQRFFRKYVEQEPSTSNSSATDSSPQELADTPERGEQERNGNPRVQVKERKSLSSSPDSSVPSDPNDTSNCYEPLELQLISNPPQLECKLEKMMQDLLVIDEAHHKLRVSTYSPRVLPETTMDEFISGTSKLGFTFEPMYTEAYEPISIRLVPEEFFIKHRIVVDISDFDYKTKKLWIAQDLIYSIEFIKALPIYHLLEECSKRVLLSSTIYCSTFTSGFYSYSQNSDRTCYPDGGTMSWSKEIHEQSPHSTLFHTGLIAALREAQLDKREYTLLKMIVVCNPMLEGLSFHDATLLQHERERYTATLASYVLARMGTKEGPARISKLLAIIDVVNKLTTWHKNQQILMMAMGLHKTRCAFTEAIFYAN